MVQKDGDACDASLRENMYRTADYWIEKLGLLPHPEGGYFRETYRSSENLSADNLPSCYSGDRSFSTAIYFLLKGDHPSLFHRLRSDEIWHFHTGSPVTIYIIDAEGELVQLRLGNDPDRGETFQGLIPAGCWFGAEVEDPGGYVLVGCTVAPGFDFADFEMGNREGLLARYLEHRQIIERLTL